MRRRCPLISQAKVSPSISSHCPTAVDEISNSFFLPFESSRRGRRSFIIEIPSSSFPLCIQILCAGLCTRLSLPDENRPAFFFFLCTTGTGQSVSAPVPAVVPSHVSPLLLFCHFKLFFKKILRHFRARLKHSERERERVVSLRIYPLRRC